MYLFVRIKLRSSSYLTDRKWITIPSEKGVLQHV